jgi:hypothetical protein
MFNSIPFFVLIIFLFSVNNSIWFNLVLAIFVNINYVLCSNIKSLHENPQFLFHFLQYPSRWVKLLPIIVFIISPAWLCGY